MAQKPMIYLVLVLLLGAGFLLGGLFGGAFIGGFTVPASHKSIVDDFKITFTIAAWGAPTSTTPKFVKSETQTWGIAKPISVFLPTKEYSYSIWLWEYGGEVQYVMQIWGPDETGKGYDIQIMRNYNPPFTVSYKGVTIINKGQISSVQEGNVWVYSEALYAFSITVE